MRRDDSWVLWTFGAGAFLGVMTAVVTAAIFDRLEQPAPGMVVPVLFGVAVASVVWAIAWGIEASHEDADEPLPPQPTLKPGDLVRFVGPAGTAGVGAREEGTVVDVVPGAKGWRVMVAWPGGPVAVGARDVEVVERPRSRTGIEHGSSEGEG